MTDSTTQSNLFVRLGQNPKDETVWREFVRRYGRLIYAWARHRQLGIPTPREE